MMDSPVIPIVQDIVLTINQDGAEQQSPTTMTVTPNAATRTVSEFMSDRYFVIDADGELLTRNEYGKALGWAFTQRGAALNAARRGNAFVYDKSTRLVITEIPETDDV